MQHLLLLNVPARQSKNYFDFLKANLPAGNLLYVDALFGGLDVCARMATTSDSANKIVQSEIIDLVQRKNETQEAVLIPLKPFWGDGEKQPAQNFILVYLNCTDDLNDASHQKSLIQFLERNGIKDKLRFAGVTQEIKQVGAIPVPDDFEVSLDNRVVSNCVLEFQISSLDDPRDLVMRKLQQFSSIASSRTYFGVNFGKEELAANKGPASMIRDFSKNWAAPLLNWKRFLGI